MKILITGANGFIGSHLSESFGLASYIYRDCNTRHEVVCMEREYKERNSDTPTFPHFFVDLTDNTELEHMLKQLQPDVIFHCAAHANVTNSINNPEYDAQANIIGTINLITNAISVGVSKIIYSSSGSVYGEQQTALPMEEGHPIDPISPYGFSKWAGEQYLKLLKFPNYCVLRYANVYGKNCRGVVKYFQECLENGISPVIYGTGDDTTRDYVHVSDVVSANRFALRNDLQGVYNVSTGVPITLNELWKFFIETNGEHNNLPVIYKDLRDGECIENVLSSEKLQTEGWQWNKDMSVGTLRL